MKRFIIYLLLASTSFGANIVQNAKLTGSSHVPSGSTLTIDSGGTLVVVGSITLTIPWSDITGTPTSVSGYGVTNGAAIDTLGAKSLNGTGNLILSAGTLAISTGQTLTVTTGGTIGSAAYTAASAYQPIDSTLTTLSGLGTTGTGAVVRAASAALTGTPTAPTPTLGTNNTQIATAAYVIANGTSISNSDGTLTFSSPTGDVVASLALSHANTWTGLQAFSAGAAITGLYTTNVFGDATSSTGGITVTSSNGDVQIYGRRIEFNASIGYINTNAQPLNISNGAITTGTGSSVTAMVIGLSGHATGDFYYDGGSGVLTRRAIGSTGQFLGVSGGVPTYQTVPGSVVANAMLPAQSAAVTSVTTITAPNDSNNHLYSVGGFVGITAISAGSLTMQVTFTDINNNTQTQSYYPMGITSATLTATGDTSFSPATILVKPNTAVIVKTTFTGVSVTYDIAAYIIQIN